jgi:hypothetical protein
MAEEQKNDTVDSEPRKRAATPRQKVTPTEAPPTTTQEIKDPGVARLVQHPSLTSAPDGDAIEVAERTIDIDTANEGASAATTQHVKDFVVPLVDWRNQDDQDEIHKRNKRAVRQGLLNQGLRLGNDDEVEFMGADEETLKSRREDRPLAGSVVLRYGVKATPAAVADAFGEQHMIVSDGPFATAEEAFEFEVGRDDRLRESRLVRAGVLAPVERTEARNSEK